MRFKVGDWVRRKAEDQRANRQLMLNGTVVEVTGISSLGWLELNGSKGWSPQCYEQVEFSHKTGEVQALNPNSLDPHALGMALVLANELERDSWTTPDKVESDDLMFASGWLRAEVQCELLSQGGQ